MLDNGIRLVVTHHPLRGILGHGHSSIADSFSIFPRLLYIKLTIIVSIRTDLYIAWVGYGGCQEDKKLWGSTSGAKRRRLFGAGSPNAGPAFWNRLPKSRPC